MKLLQIIFLSFSSFCMVQAEARMKIQGMMAAYACMDAVYALPFGANVTELGYYGLICGYEPALATTLYCATDYGTQYLHKSENTILRQALVPFNEYCYMEAGVVVNSTYLRAVYENATNYIKNDTNTTETLYWPVHFDLSGVDAEYVAYLGFYDNYDMSQIYGVIILAYWGLVFLISGIFKLLTLTRVIHFFKAPWMNKFRSVITLPALGNDPEELRTTALYFQWIKTRLATRLEWIVILGYLIVHIVILCVRYYYDVHDIIWADRQLQVARWIGDRTGIIAFAHIPLIIMFGGRNNIFQWLTGFNHSNFIQFHKWTGRVMFIDVLIHSAAYTSESIQYATFGTDTEDVYYQMGIVATIFSGFIVFQSLYFLRNSYYEIFLFIHIVLGVLFIWSCWEHCLTLGWMEWLYLSIAVWSFDRAVRLFRIALFSGVPKAKLTLCSADVIKVTVPSHNSLFRYRSKPGQYGFVYFMYPTMFWQSHPFTISDSILEKDQLSFFIKVKKGLTSRLAAQLVDGDKEMRIAIEGPYGDSSPCARYDNVLLIAGGNGAPGPLTHALELSKLEGDRTVKLCIIAHEPKSLDYIKAELKLLENTSTDVNIFYTNYAGEEAGNTKTTNSSDDEVKSEVLAITDEKQSHGSSSIKYNYFRPVISDLVQEAAGLGKPTAVVSCGPEKLCADVRYSTSKAVSTATTRIDYFEELQVW